MNQKINDPATTLKENKFKVELSLHEDKAGNPVHFLFFLIILGLLPFVLHKQRETRILGLFYLFAVLSTFLLFSALYKWQIYSTRLQLPFFVLVAPLFGIVLGGPKWASIRVTLAVVFALNGLVYLLMNPSRALLTGNSNNATLFTTPRSKLLFVNSTVFQRGYLRAANAAQATGCRSIGLVIDSSEPEYPFWALLSPSGRDVRLEHLRASPPLDRYAPPGFKPCLIICTTCAGDTWGEYQRLTNLHGAVKLYIPPDIAP